VAYISHEEQQLPSGDNREGGIRENPQGSLGKRRHQIISIRCGFHHIGKVKTGLALRY
jgi:hypothetical protein